MKRRRAAALKPKAVITSIIICTAVCLAGLGYVWAKTQVWGLSREIKKLEVRRDELQRENRALQRAYAAMCSPARLEARVKELNLGLAHPQPDQIVRLTEPTPMARQNLETRVYAANTNE